MQVEHLSPRLFDYKLNISWFQIETKLYTWLHGKGENTGHQGVYQKKENTTILCGRMTKTSVAYLIWL